MTEKPIETHPFPPAIDENTEILIMGTFPPQRHRWSMEFYYPNRTNDFWYMLGLIYYSDRYALYDKEKNCFDLDKIKALLKEKHIGLSDTGYKIRRLQDNASDKFLEIVEPIHLKEILARYPKIRRLCTTGEKAANVIAELTGTPAPKMGERVKTANGIEIWRMPSTSRAYPLKLEKKAAYYSRLLKPDS